jgi:hypothetical protein
VVVLPLSRKPPPSLCDDTQLLRFKKKKIRSIRTLFAIIASEEDVNMIQSQISGLKGAYRLSDHQITYGLILNEMSDLLQKSLRTLETYGTSFLLVSLLQ